MATLAGDVLTIDEWVKRLTKDETRTIIEVVAQDNRALASMMVTAGNEANGNTSLARTSMPGGSWTSENEGVGTERSTTEEQWDASGTLETFSIINKRYVEKAPNPKAARMQEEAAFAIGLSEEVEATVFAGDRSLFPKEFTGLAARYNSTSAGDNSDQVIDGGSGSTSVATSLWLINWGPMKCSLFFGKNNTGGLQRTDLGLDKVDLTGDGTHIMAYSTHYEWNVGLKVENRKSIARVANVLTSTYPGDIAEMMIDAHYSLPEKMMTANSKWYCNRAMAGQLHKEARKEGTVNLSLETWEGRLIPHFLGVPIIHTDAITNAEDDI